MMTLSVILISCLIPIWKESWTKAKILEIALEILCLNFSHVPLILMLFSIGQLHGVNLLLPLWIQILWSGVLFTLKDFFSALNLSEQWKNYIFIIWIGFMLFISLIFLFLYSQYAELVLTTIYDKDIPKGFFLNPLLTISGLLYYQTGGTTQMNMEPVLIFSLFWCSFILLCYGVTHSYQRRARGIVYEKSKN